MLHHLRPALVLIAVFTLLTGLATPLGLVGAARLAWPSGAGGSLIERDGRILGSVLIGQSFTSDRYFHGRPSATTDADPADAGKQVAAPYNAAASLASNLAPTAKALIGRVREDAAGAVSVPADALTTSASGLDPHISPANAARQVARVAAARGLPEERVRALLAARTEGRLLGFIGEPRVNVLLLNLDLDAPAAQLAGFR